MRVRTLLAAGTTILALAASAAIAPGAGAASAPHRSASPAAVKAVAHSTTGVHGVKSRLSREMWHGRRHVDPTTESRPRTALPRTPA